MGKVRFLACAMFAMVISVSLSAQQAENRDENGKIVRGPYITNKFFDNWFVGVGGGVNIFMNGENDYKGRVAPALDVYAGKWFTPDFGVRAVYSGLAGSMNATKVADGTGASYDDKALEKFQFWYIHGDLMWNFVNTIWGYKESRFWTSSLYAHFGGMRLFDHTNDAYEGTGSPQYRNHPYDNELAIGAGLYNTLRISKRVYGTIDVRETILPSRYHAYETGGVTSDLTVLAGIGVYLGRVGWDRMPKEKDDAAAAAAAAGAAAALAAAEAALADAKKANDDLAKKNNALADDLDNAKKALADAADKAPADSGNFKYGIAPCTVFFDLDSYELNVTELEHLDFYVKNIIARDPDHTFYITGKADKGTGSMDHNEELSYNRAMNVRKIIIEKYGISPDRIVFKENKVSSEFDEPRLDRAVIIEH